MIKNIFRIRFNNYSLSDNLIKIFNSDYNIGRSLLNIHRIEILYYFSILNLPLTIDNVVFLTNQFYMKNEHISKITPQIIFDEILNLQN
jgi:hypothetical protein